MSDFSTYKALKVSELTSNADFSAQPAGAIAVVAQNVTREHYFNIANITATTTEAAMLVARSMPYAGVLKSFTLTPINASAASSTSVYSTINLYKRGANGTGAAVLMASANLSGVVVTQWNTLSAALVANGANFTVAQGDVVTANVVLTSTGTANNIAMQAVFTVEDY